MKSKIRTIIALGIIGVVVILTTLIILLNGSKNGGFNYARIDYAASVEFVTNTKNTVVAYRPLNENARYVLADMKVEGEKIDDVISNIMEESFKMGYFDLNKTITPIYITTVGGITQAFDIKVYESINDFFVNNQIMGIIIENINNKDKYMEAKKLKVSINELMLIESIVHSTDIPKETLNKKMPDELIDIIMDIDDEYAKNNPATNDEILNKNMFIDNYKEDYINHKKGISKDNLRNYMEKRTQLKRKYQRKLELGETEI